MPLSLDPSPAGYKIPVRYQRLDDSLPGRGGRQVLRARALKAAAIPLSRRARCGG